MVRMFYFPFSCTYFRILTVGDNAATWYEKKSTKKECQILRRITWSKIFCNFVFQVVPFLKMCELYKGKDIVHFVHYLSYSAWYNTW